MYVCMIEVYWVGRSLPHAGQVPSDTAASQAGQRRDRVDRIWQTCLCATQQARAAQGWLGPHVGLHAVQQTSPCLACRGYTCGKSIRVQQEGHDLATGACSYRHSTSSDASIRAQHMSTGARAFRRWRRLPHLHCEILQHPGESKR